MFIWWFAAALTIAADVQDPDTGAHTAATTEQQAAPAPAPAPADEGQLFQQLLDINVAVATKAPQKLSIAPGIITAYRDTDIERLGYYTLADLADITPGYSTNVIWGEHIFITRGQRTDQFENNKHLLVVDGIPINAARDYKAWNQEELPLYFAKQVEFLRGPASALYGTSAFLGVVNVVPKELEKPGILVETRSAMGTLDNDIQVSTNLLGRTDTSVSRISAAFYRKMASKDPVHAPGAPIDPEFLFWDDKNDIFVNASHKWIAGPLAGLNPGMFIIRENGGLGESWYGTFSNEANDITFESFIPYIKYTREFLPEVLTFDSYVKVHIGREKGWHVPVRPDDNFSGVGEIFEAYEINVVDWEALAQLRWTPLDYISVIGGVDYDMRWSLGPNQSSYIYAFNALGKPGNPQEGEPTVGSGTKFNTASVFAQAQGNFDFLAGTSITLGIRNDNGSVGARWYSHASPRVAVVQKFTEWLGLKLLYSTALRAPAIKEVGRNIEAAGEGEHPPSLLLPESLTSFEAAIVVTTPHFGGSVTGFFNEVDDVLANIKHPGFNDEFFQNIPGQSKAAGVEVDAHYLMSEALDIFGNYSFARSQDPSGQPVTDVPTHMANVGISSTLPISFDLRLTAVGKFINSWQTNLGGPQPHGWTIFDIKAGSRFAPNWLAEVQLRNLFDAEYRRPQNGIAIIPGAGRTLLVALEYAIK